ncbi:MAG: hypothetical protein ACI857_001476, partial [Arenicella sp.]
DAYVYRNNKSKLEYQYITKELSQACVVMR